MRLLSYIFFSSLVVVSAFLFFLFSTNRIVFFLPPLWTESKKIPLLKKESSEKRGILQWRFQGTGEKKTKHFFYSAEKPCIAVVKETIGEWQQWCAQEFEFRFLFPIDRVVKGDSLLIIEGDLTISDFSGSLFDEWLWIKNMFLTLCQVFPKLTTLYLKFHTYHSMLFDGKYMYVTRAMIDEELFFLSNDQGVREKKFFLIPIFFEPLGGVLYNKLQKNRWQQWKEKKNVLSLAIPNHSLKKKEEWHSEVIKKITPSSDMPLLGIIFTESKRNHVTIIAPLQQKISHEGMFFSLYPKETITSLAIERKNEARSFVSFLELLLQKERIATTIMSTPLFMVPPFSHDFFLLFIEAASEKFVESMFYIFDEIVFS